MNKYFIKYIFILFVFTSVVELIAQEIKNNSTKIYPIHPEKDDTIHPLKRKYILIKKTLGAFNPLLMLNKSYYGPKKYSSTFFHTKNLMIVAHPDDESLWGGCELMKGDWHVISVTNASHRIRRKEFMKAMEFVGASWEIWDHQDSFFKKSYHPDLVRDLSKVVQGRAWNKIVTHGPGGEYGHRQHKGLWAVMRNLVKGQLWVFDPFSKSKINAKCKKDKLKLLGIYKSQRSTFKHLGGQGADAKLGIFSEKFKLSP